MLKQLNAAIKENIRDYGMYIALAFIMFIFTNLTDGLFMTPNSMVCRTRGRTGNNSIILWY